MLDVTHQPDDMMNTTTLPSRLQNKDENSCSFFLSLFLTFLALYEQWKLIGFVKNK